MFDLFLATSIAFGSESVNAIRHCSGGVCSAAVDTKNKLKAKVVKQSRFKGILRGKKCR